jgi:hypothetical protein
MEHDVNRSQLLRRRSASDYLRARGFPVAASTLAKLASIGGGPGFQHFGRVPLYTPEALDHWADSRLSAAVASTSELERRADAGDPPREVAGVPGDEAPRRPPTVQVEAARTGRAGR